MFSLSAAFVAAFLASTAAAHGGVNDYVIDGMYVQLELWAQLTLKCYRRDVRRMGAVQQC